MDGNDGVHGKRGAGGGPRPATGGFEAALRESERRFRRLLEQIADTVIIIDRDGRCTDVNRAACESLGYARDVLTRLRLTEIDEAVDESNVGHVWDAMRSGDYASRAAVYRRRDGSTFHVDVSAVAIEVDGDPRVLTIARDVTERRDAERALGESQERFRLMVEGSDQVFFFAHGPDHRFTYLSPSVEAVLGYSPDELLGQPFEVLHPGDPTDEQVQEMTKLALATGTSQRAYTAVNRHKDGRTIPVEIVESPLVRDGRVVGLQGFARDISERVRAERALRESEEQLRHAQKMEAVGRLAGGIAHDFNNIMTAIIGHADFLLSDLPEDDARREDAEEIRRTAGRAAVLTRQLLAFSRKQILQPRVLDLNEVVRGTAKMLRRMIGEDVALRIDTGAGVGCIEADRGQLEQTLVNLVLNARDAMPDGGDLTITTERVDFAEETAPPHLAVAAGRYARLSVRDTGTGMSEDVRERIFEPFFTTKEHGRGTGLGLSTAYGIVKQSGGDIEVDTTPGRGSTFALYLPASDHPTDTAERGGSGSAETAPADDQTILVIEDEDAVRAMVRRTLARRGYAVLEAADGAEALDVARRHEGRIDLVVTDVVMPGLSGREVAERLAEIRPSTTILFTSGHTEDEILKRGVMSAKDEFLAKPFSPKQLVEIVAGLLARVPS